MNGKRRTHLRNVMLFITLTIILTGLSLWKSVNSFSQHLQNFLEDTLGDKINGVQINQIESDSRLKHYIIDRINTDLAYLQPLSTLSLLKSCQARVTAYNGDLIIGLKSEQEFTIGWSQHDQWQKLKIGLLCKKNWPALWGSQALIAFLALTCILTIPLKASTNRRKYKVKLLTQKVSTYQAIRLTRHIDSYNSVQLQLLDCLLEQQYINPKDAFCWVETEQVTSLKKIGIEWFELALALQPGDIKYALIIAQSAPRLLFEPSQRTVSIHGITIKLPSTPFFYYLWYASLRLENIGLSESNEGWFTNPPSNRPDTHASQPLIELMTRYGGHSKAIKELEEKGLRAKTLDQNRNKIKEELTKVLGDNLAENYLFSTQRDSHLARNRYRLTLSPEWIQLSPTPFTSHKGS